ncbi:Transmembrane_domain-containing protein [Hexamita inflata]|uniref:Transmembrane domain-containing protein n=1 Tax=Hexamita inflata TaxID=28002 RepID=A0AA86QX07_9EUKA|nr:Transmembrane domain-containing protein [Hexamita inflata]
MVNWYDDEVVELFQKNLTFQIGCPIVVILYAFYYFFALKKEAPLLPQLKPYLSLVFLTNSLIILVTFVSIGPWTIENRFYVLFLFSILQFFVYSIISLVLFSNFNKQMRVLCMKVSIKESHTHAFFLRFYACVCLVLLALWIHFSYEWACSYIDKSLLDKHANSKPFNRLLFLLSGTNVVISIVHLVAALMELIWGFISLCLKGNSTFFHRKTVNLIQQNEKLNISYDVESEEI